MRPLVEPSASDLVIERASFVTAEVSAKVESTTSISCRYATMNGIRCHCGYSLCVSDDYFKVESKDQRLLRDALAALLHIVKYCSASSSFYRSEVVLF